MGQNFLKYFTTLTTIFYYYSWADWNFDNNVLNLFSLCYIRKWILNCWLMFDNVHDIDEQCNIKMDHFWKFQAPIGIILVPRMDLLYKCSYLNILFPFVILSYSHTLMTGIQLRLIMGWHIGNLVGQYESSCLFLKRSWILSFNQNVTSYGKSFHNISLIAKAVILSV